MDLRSVLPHLYGATDDPDSLLTRFQARGGVWDRLCRDPRIELPTGQGLVIKDS
jgi:hypothetical protein